MVQTPQMAQSYTFIQTKPLNKMETSIYKPIQEKVYYSPFSGEIWTIKQWNEYVAFEESREEKNCGSECYGCAKCEEI